MKDVCMMKLHETSTVVHESRWTYVELVVFWKLHLHTKTSETEFSGDVWKPKYLRRGVPRVGHAGVGREGVSRGCKHARKSLSLGNWEPLRLDETRARCRYLAAFPQM